MSTSTEIPSRIVLVMLATGKQGTGLVRALARVNDSALPDPAPWTILAQTRDASAPKSVALAALRGVHLVQGSPDTPETLFAAAPGPVYAVYSVQLGLDNPNGLDAEMAQARALADAAAAHGVRHFIYAGANFGGVAGNRTNVPHFDTKRIGEEYLKSAHPTLPTTVLRPVTFMDQLVQGDPASAVSRLTKIMFLCQLAPTTRLQFVAASDVGAVAALILQHPEMYIGRIVDVAGDELAPRDLEDGWREVFGVEMRPQMVGGSALSWIVRTATKDLRLMFKFFNEVGYNVDITVARKVHPEMKDWKTFLRTEAPKPA
ncbi:NmrA domain-containing protein [Mycena sanguinolenta]|uniref:NmrA domain-containing protein n=1 Tax=Mycena sanguinolenta TaxID=230812 RepID=A0A8H7DLB8_9AGAR|nr:NmrA domain-containing protein [Mycena sanguinolenta]